MSEEQLIPTPGVFGETGNFLLERELGRGGMGVRLVRLTEGAKLVSVSVVEAEDVENESGAATEESGQ